MRNKLGQFKPGIASNNKAPVGTVRIRTRHKRGGEKRAWVKIAEPNIWRLRAQVVWETANPPIPRGMGIHHKDENKLNDVLENLQLVSKAEHLDEHRAAYLPRIVPQLIAARKARRWSTKSATKKTGRPCPWPDSVMIAAVADYKAGGGSLAEVAARHGVTKSALAKRYPRV